MEYFAVEAGAVSGPGGALSAALSEADAADLVAAVREARRAQSAELAQAATEALGHVPWPLRGAVRKVVGL